MTIDTAKKGNIWTKLSLLKKRATIIVGILTALGAVGKFSYNIIEHISDFQSTMHDVIELKTIHTKNVKLINEQKMRIDSLKNHQIEEDFNLRTIMTISKLALKDFYIGEIRFKIAPDKSMYYIVEGNIYPAILDKYSKQYYYVTSKKSIWCD